MLIIDTILQDRYRIIRQLGQGGMGAVYEAIDERLGKTVAIKEILLELTNSSDETKSNQLKTAFRREANSLVKARHSAVPDVTDYFSENDGQFLVMEYIEGDDLAKMLEKRNKPFSIEEVLPWINQLLEALNYLHNLESPIIHRDIKPQNLKLNEWNNIKLLDFGIAKSTDVNAAVTQNTFLGATLNYSPIEQVLRVIDPTFREFIKLKHKDKAEHILNQDTDSRCDIFALGATFYHLLTNKVPIDITKRALEMWEERNDPFEDPSQINPDIPRAVSLWLKKAMAFEREDRYLTAFEMQTALKEALSLNSQKETTEYKVETVEHKVETAEQNLETPPTNNHNADLTEKMLAETVRLSSTELLKMDQIADSTKDEIPAETVPIPIPINQSNEPISESETVSFNDIGVTDFKPTNTDFSVSQTSDELTVQNNIVDENNFIAEELPEIETKNVVKIPLQQEETKQETNNNRKYFLALPIFGVLIFAVFGIGFLALMSFTSSSETTNDNNSININATPEATTELESSVETNSNTIIANSNENNGTTLNDSDEPKTNQTSTTTEPNPTTTKPTPTKPNVKPTSNPVSTPKPPIQPTPKPTIKQTPKPVPTKTKTPKPKKPVLFDEIDG